MPAEKLTPTLSPLVALLYDLDARIEALGIERKATAQALIDLGEGPYIDDTERKAIVIIPTKFSTSYTLYPAKALKALQAERKEKKPTPALVEEFRDLQEAAARALAGDHFKTLFDRVVLQQPTDGYEKLVPKLLTPAKARDALLLCQVVKAPGAAQVRLPDRPKKAGDEDEEE